MEKYVYLIYNNVLYVDQRRTNDRFICISGENLLVCSENIRKINFTVDQFIRILLKMKREFIYRLSLQIIFRKASRMNTI